MQAALFKQDQLVKSEKVIGFCVLAAATVTDTIHRTCMQDKNTLELGHIFSLSADGRFAQQNK